MSGNWATGSVLIVSSPANIISMARTVANIGRSMKNLLNIVVDFLFVGLFSGGEGGVHFHAVAHFHERAGDIAVVGAKA